jgi:hypothetical protein
VLVKSIFVFEDGRLTNKLSSLWQEVSKRERKDKKRNADLILGI